jgi:quinol monooxygenase YgiN
LKGGLQSEVVAALDVAFEQRESEMAKQFTCIWEFEVPAATEAEFRRHYGPGGSWVALFRNDPAFVETLLLRDPSREGRYVTIDRWQSAEAYRLFRQNFSEQYQALDKICDGLTKKETDLGSFLVVDDGASA